MADNYLEKKMEELHSGKTGTINPSNRMHTGKKQSWKGLISFPFPSKRFVFYSSYSDECFEIASYFQSIGCSIAVLGIPSCKKEENIAEKYLASGIRVIKEDIANDSCKCYRTLDNLLKDWKKVDIILNFSTSEEFAQERIPEEIFNISEYISNYLTSHPAPSDYTPRIISIFPPMQTNSLTAKRDNNILRATPRNINGFTHFCTSRYKGYGASTKLKQDLMFLSLPQATQFI